MVSERPIRVVLADDHARLRGLVRDALEAGGCQVVGEAATAEEVVRLAKEHTPDVALLDIKMPGGGIRAAYEISASLPQTTIVMLSQSDDDDDLFDSLRAGAVGYLLKDTPPAQLGSTLRAATAGQVAMSPRLMLRVLDEFRAPKRRRLGRLTSAATKLSAREWEVMELLSQGLTTEQVASRLFLSTTTVRVHVSSVLRKLRVKDRASALELLRDE